MKLALAAALAVVLLPARGAFAADDLDKVLRKLDEAASIFHTTSADFKFDTIETDPVYDDDEQTGVIYYERQGNKFQMGAHFDKHNKKPSPKIYTYSNGVFQLFEPGINQVTILTKANKFESYVMLGFGASGNDLQAKWDIRFVGWETINGVKTAVLELVAKDPDVRKNLSKVTIWIDPDRAVSLKQVFTLSPTSSKECLYSNFKLNSSLPADAFTFQSELQAGKGAK